MVESRMWVWKEGGKEGRGAKGGREGKREEEEEIGRASCRERV